MGDGKRPLWRAIAPLVGVLGLVATAAAVAAAPGQLAAARVWALVATMVAVEALATRAARGRGYTTFTSSTVFACAALLTDGTAAGMVVFAVGGVLTSLLHGRPASRTLFNAGQLSLSALLAAAVVAPLGGRDVLLDGGVDLAGALLTVIALVLGWFLANLVFLLPAVVLVGDDPPRTILRSVLRQHVPTALGVLSLAPLIAVVVVHAPALSPLLAVPMASLLRLLQRFLEHEREAQRDGLTGLANQSAFSEAVERAVDDAGRTGRVAGVLVVDLDDFKALNDAHGHPAGDGVLRAVETVLLAPIRFGEGLQPVRASVGAATSPAGGVTAAALVAAADASMYDAKQAGREPARASVEQGPPPRRRPGR